MNSEEDVRQSKAIEQAEVLLRGLRSRQIHSFIAVAVGDGAEETYYSGDLTGKHVASRLIGIMTVAQIKMAGRFGESEYVRGPKG